MPTPDFVFRVDLSDGPAFDAMVADIARTVLGHAGYKADTIAEITRQLRDALGARAAGGSRECHLAFRAEDGQLHIAAGRDGGVEWHTARALP